MPDETQTTPLGQPPSAITETYTNLYLSWRRQCTDPPKAACRAFPLSLSPAPGGEGRRPRHRSGVAWCVGVGLGVGIGPQLSLGVSNPHPTRRLTRPPNAPVVGQELRRAAPVHAGPLLLDRAGGTNRIEALRQVPLREGRLVGVPN